MIKTQEKFLSSLKFGGVILLCWAFVIFFAMLFTNTQTIISRSVPTENTALVLPEGFTATPESFDGKEILYHLNIENNSKHLRGYFEILNVGTDLDNYLENAEQYKAADINQFKILQGDRPGSIIWEYTTPKSNVRSFFTKKGQRLFVLTLSADKDKVTMSDLTENFTLVLKGLVI